jgi:hypothetical protein
MGLMLGSSWGAGPGAMSPQPYRFVPTVEAGLSLRGDPILGLSSFDVPLGKLRAAADEPRGETFCRRNPGLCIGAVAAVAAVIVVVLVAQDSEECDPNAGVYPPGQHPCRCYEATGC